VGHVFRTSDYGQHWTDISGNLPDTPTSTIVLDSQTNTLYVGTDIGVYASSNGGVTWAPFQTGMPNVRVVDLELCPALNILAAGTHGRGMWEILVPGPSASSTALASTSVAGPSTLASFSNVNADTPTADMPLLPAAVSSPSNGQTMSVPSSMSIPGSSNSLSAADQVLANFTLLPSDVRNAYHSELSSVSAMWQSIDALALQRLDALLSIEAGAMGMSKDALMRDLLFASMSLPNG
jgi:hypothetical protein